MATMLGAQVDVCVEAVRRRAGSEAPAIGVVLGSGLGGFADTLQDAVVVPYAELPGFPTSSVQGHAGRLVVGQLGQRRVVALQGRAHFYEGYTPAQVTFPVRVLGRLGVRTLVVTNAAGGVNPTFAPGDLMAIVDHLNLAGYNPLVGPNDEALGPRFPDLSFAYTPALLELLRRCAREEGLALREGVYACLSGPSYETPAEIRMLRTLGADAVGMSTVPEVIVAAHMGLQVAGLSCITNLAAGLGTAALSHQEVGETAARVRGAFSSLLGRLVARAPG